MKKRYQIEKHKAVLRLQQQAGQTAPIQLSFALSEVIEQLQQGLLELVRQVGIQVLEQFMVAEVGQLTQPQSGSDSQELSVGTPARLLHSSRPEGAAGAAACAHTAAERGRAGQL